MTTTTVGYGDLTPVTTAGRSTGVFVMFAGVGIIGALASILASVLIPQPKTPAAPGANELTAELVAIRREIAALRASTAPRDEPTD